MDTDNLDHIGENIRKLRKERGLSQKQLALSIGVDPTQYSRLENGKVVPALKSLLKVAKVLEVGLDQIVFSATDPTEEVQISDKSLYEKVKLIDQLPEEEKQLVFKVMELALTKKQFKDFFEEKLAL